MQMYLKLHPGAGLKRSIMAKDIVEVTTSAADQ